MVIEEGISLNASEIGKEVGESIISSMPPEVSASFHNLINILEAIGIVVLIYIIFLIIKAFFTIKTSKRIKKISQNVEEINSKLDSLVKKKTSRKA